jgi:hypothetical protein
VLWTRGFRFANDPNPPSGTLDFPSEVELDSLGRAVVSGTRRGGDTFRPALTRFTPTGDIDSTFGAGGYVTLPAGTGLGRYGRSLEIDDHDRPVVMLTSVDDDGPSELVRLTAGGSVDGGFGGILPVDGAFDGPGEGGDLQLGPGFILYSGNLGNSTTRVVALWRFDSEGKPDPAFSGDGLAFVEQLAGYNDIVGGSLEVDGGGGALIAATAFTGSEGRRPVLARFRLEGAGPDPGGDGSGAAGEVAASGRGIDVRSVQVPNSLRKLFARGVKVEASCELDCRIVVELHVSKAVARRMLLGSTLVGVGTAMATGGQLTTVVAKISKSARRAVRTFAGRGRLKIRVTGEAP